MGTPRRIRIGLVVGLLALLSLNLLPPFPAFAQDEEGASDAPAIQEELAPPADTTPPVLSQPLDLVVPAEDVTGAGVAYVVPETIDETDGTVPVACVPESGSRIPLGSTEVTCAARDAAENSNAVTFVVTISDQTVPVFDGVTDVHVDATEPGGAMVNFVVPGARDNVDGQLAISCDWASGAHFPVGTSVVTCWEMDNVQNQAAVSFAVTVNAFPVPTDPPTEEPTNVPTDVPIEVPTETPTNESTEEPTKSPAPTETPRTTEGPFPTEPAASSTQPTPPTEARPR
jgi:hypothetical protein